MSLSDRYELTEAVGRLFRSEDNPVRFTCICGVTWKYESSADGGHALEHTFEGHEVVRERWSLGAWHFVDTLNGRTVSEMVWNALKKDGEDPERFLARLQQAVAERDEEIAAVEAAREAVGER
ncbi:MAG: hypothetical protein O2888_03385 [Chloroflexi bacterium]|nr:hypothetical protein [Chloroflexota bacterium]